MGGGRDQVREKERSLAIGVDEQALMPGRVAGSVDGANAGDDLSLALDEIEFAGLEQRNEVVSEIASRRALVGVGREFVFAALHDVARLGKGRTHRIGAIADSVAARVIEMQ